MSPRPLVAALLALACLVAAPAHAVVGGSPVRAAQTPWFVGTGLCGGTLIAPDRIVTAAHCVDPIDYDDLAAIVVAGQARRGTRVALPPTWRTQRAGFALEDIAIVALDRPVTGVTPVALGTGRAPARVQVVGRGQIHAPAPGDEAAAGLYGLRRAWLRSVGDAACSQTWRRSRTRYRDRFEAALMLCATDVDGRAPLASVCAGDSGGPLASGTLARPVLQGVISWTGPRCGADRLPSVAADVRHHRAFLTDPAPVWAPVPAGGTRIAGTARVGETLTCAAPDWAVAPDRVELRWRRRVRTARAYEWRPAGAGDTHTVQGADRGRLLTCEALGSNAGGRAQAPPGPASTVRVE